MNAFEKRLPIPSKWYGQFINIKDMYQQCYNRKGYGMKSMLDALHLSLDGRHHRGIDDSRNIAKILQCIVNDRPLNSNIGMLGPLPIQQVKI